MCLFPRPPLLEAKCGERVASSSALRVASNVSKGRLQQAAVVVTAVAAVAAAAALAAVAVAAADLVFCFFILHESGQIGLGQRRQGYGG